MGDRIVLLKFLAVVEELTTQETAFHRVFILMSALMLSERILPREGLVAVVNAADERLR